MFELLVIVAQYYVSTVRSMYCTCTVQYISSYLIIVTFYSLESGVCVFADDYPRFSEWMNE